jgi:GntR family transcriptional regulator
VGLLAGSELLHRRVSRVIAEDIAAGVLAPGDRLPSERDLSEKLHVSRATVRRALADLVDECLIEARAGRGSFVSSGPIGEAPNALMSLSELGASRGLATESRVLSSDTRPATPDEAEALEIAPGATVFVLERLRLLDGVPMSLDTNRIPLAVAPVLPEIDFTSASLYETLDAAGAGPVRAIYSVQAVEADVRRARLLEVAPGAPLLETATVAYDRTGQRVELGEMIYRGDRYRFRASLTRRPR